MAGQEQNHRDQGRAGMVETFDQVLIMSKNISSLTNLKILSIQSNRLTTISGLSGLSSLEELYISHNALTEISGLDSNAKLRVLDISNNQISHLTNLKHLEHLEELWASSNQISSFDEVEKELADGKELSTVYFEGNPLQTKNPVLYRNKVHLALPHIQQIDASMFGTPFCIHCSHMLWLISCSLRTCFMTRLMEH